jgi:hypothetical protein
MTNKFNLVIFATIAWITKLVLQHSYAEVEVWIFPNGGNTSRNGIQPLSFFVQRSSDTEVLNQLKYRATNLLTDDKQMSWKLCDHTGNELENTLYLKDKDELYMLKEHHLWTWPGKYLHNLY